jgi:hypothetical protein
MFLFEKQQDKSRLASALQHSFKRFPRERLAAI